MATNTTNVTTSFIGKASSKYFSQLYAGGNSLDYFVVEIDSVGTFYLRTADSSNIVKTYSCTSDPSGTININSRTITPATFEIKLDFCDNILRNAWQRDFRKAALLDQKLPDDFNEWLINDMLKKAKLAVEISAWFGNTASTSGNDNITAANGIITIAAGDSATIKVSNPVATINGSNGLTEIDRMLALAPAVLRADPRTKIFLTDEFYYGFVDSLTYTYGNNPNYNVKDGEGNPMYRGIPVIRVPQFDTNPKGLITYADSNDGNLVIAVNMVDDVNKVKIEQMPGNDITRIRLVWMNGVNVARPEMVVVYGTATA